MHTTKNTNAVVKIGRRYVCHLPFWSSNPFTSLNKTCSLLSIYSNRSTQHKHTGPRQTISCNVNNWNGLVQHFKFLMIFVMRRYFTNLGLQDRGWEFGWEGQVIGKDWSSKIWPSQSFLNSYLNHPTSFGFESKVIMDLNDLRHVWYRVGFISTLAKEKQIEIHSQITQFTQV
jgi:hypothetical protein